MVVTKLSDVSDLLVQARLEPRQSFAKIMKLAASEDWKEREVAATVLVEASKKKAADILAEMIRWAEHSDPNVRRTASEGLRDIARKDPARVLPILEKLKSDQNIYVKKSVANVLRNAGNYAPEFVLGVCDMWAKSKDPNTAWIIKDALRKLKAKYPERVDEIMRS